MDATIVAAAVAALVAGVGGFAVPRLIAVIPEPPAPEPPAPEVEPAPEPEVEPEAPKEPYAHIGAVPGLGWRSAVAGVVIGALVGAATGLDWSLLWLAPLVPVGVALSVVDWRTRLLPRLVVLPTTWLVVVAMVVVGLATGDTEALLRALVAMVVTRTFFWLLWAMHSAGMGFGDVRLAAVVGLVLGWVGWGVLMVGVWVGFAAFALPGVVLALAKRDRSLLRKPFPYGPFMLAGAVFGLVWGPAVARVVWG